MEIPANIIDFLGKNVFAHVGSRDENLHPAYSMGWGIRYRGEKNRLTVFISAEAGSKKTLANLLANGNIAVTSSEFPSHESYQFKGKYVSHCECTAEDVQFQHEHTTKINEHFAKMGMPPAYFAPVKYEPGIAVTFEVNEIFVQTPAPGTGKKI